MNFKPMMLILSLSLLFFSSKCQVETMVVPFIKDQQGLKAEHLNQLPLLEQVVQHPGATESRASRIYADGSLYFHSADSVVPPLWAYFTKVKPAGITQLTEIFEAACSAGAPAGVGPTDEGSEIFRFQTERCGKEIVITGVNFGNYKDLQKVNNIINANLEPFVIPGGQ